MGNPDEPLLDRHTTYYYRVKANLEGGGYRNSNSVSGQVSGPVRDVEGDLWADIVIGKPDFTQNVIGKPTEHGTFFGGGLVIDKTVRPNRMYIADCNNNRILGIQHFGVVELDLSNSQNLAKSKTYTKSLPPDGAYPDTNNREFTDGNLSTSHANSLGDSFSSPADVAIDVDLWSIEEIDFVVYSTGGGTEGYRASALTVFVSLDGTEWTEVSQKTNPGRAAEIKVRFDAIQARHVRFRGFLQETPGWLFIGEGKVGKLTDAQIAEEGLPCSADSDC